MRRVVLFAAVISFTACMRSEAYPKELPFLRGTLLEERPSGWLLVVNPPRPMALTTDTVFVQLGSGTKVQRRDGGRARTTDLQVGQTIALWIVGTIIDTQPPKVTALRMVLE